MCKTFLNSKNTNRSAWKRRVLHRVFLKDICSIWRWKIAITSSKATLHFWRKRNSLIVFAPLCLDCAFLLYYVATFSLHLHYMLVKAKWLLVRDCWDRIWNSYSDPAVIIAPLSALRHPIPEGRVTPGYPKPVCWLTFSWNFHERIHNHFIVIFNDILCHYVCVYLGFFCILCLLALLFSNIWIYLIIWNI